MDESVMAKQPDFLQTILDMMGKRMDDLGNKIDTNNVAMNKRVDAIEDKIDTNTSVTQGILTEAKYTNGRVSRNEKSIVRLESKKGKKLELPPNVIYLIALGAVILLAVIATLLHINLGNLL